MNPLTNMKNVVKLSEQELKNTGKSSWHDQYKDSAWIFVGGLPYDLTEGDIICIFSQYGEIVNINLIRDKDTGKSKGFCFLCYEDQRSTILAVDNFNGIKILKRIIRVDHVQKYKVPTEGKKTDEETKKLYAEGCAPKATPLIPKTELPKQDVRETLADQIEGGIKLPARLPIYTTIKGEKISDNEEPIVKKEKKSKKKKKDKKKKPKKKKSKKVGSGSDESSSSDSESERQVKVKTEKSGDGSSSEEEDRNKRSRVKKVEKTGERSDSEERDWNKTTRDFRDDKYKYSESRSDRERSSKYILTKNKKYSSSSEHSSNRNKDKGNSSKRSDRSRSRDRDEKPRKTDVSPNIPKRWR